MQIYGPFDEELRKETYSCSDTEGESQEDSIPDTCAGFSITDIRSSMMNEERKSLVKLGFKHLIRESFQVKYKLLHPSNLKWKKRRAITKNAVTAGAVVNGIQEDNIRWYVEEVGLGLDDVIDDEVAPSMNVFDDYVVRDAKCDRVCVGGRIQCPACNASRKAFFRRCTHAAELRSLPPHKNKTNTVLERTPTLMKEKIKTQLPHERDHRHRSRHTQARRHPRRAEGARGDEQDRRADRDGCAR